MLESDRRKIHNNELLRKMKAGENLTTADTFSLWFPPRPIIKKDTDIIKTLYGSDTKIIGEPQSFLPKVVKDKEGHTTL
jgi:hypothetical protein